jgi:MFS family permease
MPSTFRTLHHRNFRYLWLGQTARAATLWMDVVARSVLVLNLTGSAVWLSAVLAARAAPVLFLGLPAGAVVDRLDRRRLLLATQVVGGAVYLYLGLAVVGGFIDIWQVMITGVVIGASRSFYQPARQSVLSMVVPRENILNAVALNSTSISFMRIFGGSAAGALLVVTDVGGVYLVCAGIFIFVIIMTVLLRLDGGTPPAPRNGDTRMVDDLREGIAYVRGHPALAMIIGLASILFIFGFPYQQIFVPLLAKRTLDIGDAGVGFLTGAIGVGALIGSLVVATKGKFERPALLMIVNMLVFGGALIAVTLVSGLGEPRVVAIGGTMFLLAMAGSMTVTYMSLTNSLLLAGSDPAMHGRVMSLLGVGRGMIPAGAVLAGLLATALGVLPALFVMASLVLVLGAGALVAFRSTLRTIGQDGKTWAEETEPDTAAARPHIAQKA